MLQCQNCGQVINYQSNFCRFCGTKLVLPRNSNNAADDFLAPPPRPYMWKTDEFQVNENPARKAQNIKQVQPIPQQRTMNANFAPPMMYQNPANLAAAGYHCPNCGTPHLPRIVQSISPVGWVMFAILLVLFFPLFWIGLLIKEDKRICPICNVRVS